MMDESNKSNIKTLNKGGSKSFSTQCPNCNTFALKQSDAKLKPVAFWLLAFSATSDSIFVSTMASYWVLLIYMFSPFSRCDDLNMDFTTLIRNALYRALKQGSS